MKSKTINRLHKQTGSSNMEMLFYLILAALVVGGAIALGLKLFNKQTNNGEQTNVANLIVNTRALKGSQGYGTNGANLIPQLITTDGIPDGLTNSSGAIFNSWNGTVTVTSTGPAFVLTYGSIPQDSCVSLATKVAKTRAYSTKINSGTAVIGEVDSATATTNCSATTNTIAWTISQ
ncbi:type 4 pilus major pilin [Pseudomonas sp. MDT1-17]